MKRGRKNLTKRPHLNSGLWAPRTGTTLPAVTVIQLVDWLTVVSARELRCLLLECAGGRCDPDRLGMGSGEYDGAWWSVRVDKDRWHEVDSSVLDGFSVMEGVSRSCLDITHVESVVREKAHGDPPNSWAGTCGSISQKACEM